VSQEPPADVEVGAAAKARRLRFRRRPETRVTIHGEGESRTQRENLPEEVKPGVEYRDVKVRWRASARVRDEGPPEPGSDR
jgi:hypothetical protein